MDRAALLGSLTTLRTRFQVLPRRLGLSPARREASDHADGSRHPSFIGPLPRDDSASIPSQLLSMRRVAWMITGVLFPPTPRRGAGVNAPRDRETDRGA